MNQQLIQQFTELFQMKPVVYAAAPGRLEVLGNHTDYNEGLVLSCAVGQHTELCLTPVEGTLCCIHDFRDTSTIEFDINDIDTPVKGDWGNYIKGCILALRERGITIPAFYAAIVSTVPLSAGMSSSAALEMAFCFAAAKAFNIELPPAEWARVGQYVENKYLGLGSGLLDQFSSIFGKKNALILCDFRTVEVIKTIAVPQGYELVVANSMVKHNLVESDYNLRRQSCEKARDIIKTRYPEIKALRDVTPEMLEACRDVLDNVDYLRAKHVVHEGDRVLRAEKLLGENDIIGFGQLLWESHESSRVDFKNSCEELDVIIELAKSIPGCIGGRLSGGGFGGIAILLVETGKAEEFCERLRTVYKLQTQKPIETIICSIGDGASAATL